MSAGNLGNTEERRRSLDHRDQPGRPRCHAPFCFNLVDDLGKQPHMFGAVHFGQGQRQDARTDRGLDVAHGKAQRAVDADHDIGAAA